MLAYHVILCAYGFWLPNDPRGSWSRFVWSDDLFRFGAATKVATRRSVAHQPHDAAYRLAAKEKIQYPPVHFSGIQALTISQAVSEGARKFEAPIWACAILPEHLHLVMGVGNAQVERIMATIKQSATWKLRQQGQHPLIAHRSKSRRTPSPWARGFWKVFIDDVQHLLTAIRYVEQNPLKEGKPLQRWSFVVPFHANAPHT